MEAVKKAAAVIFSLMLGISICFTDAYAAESKWDIENTLNQEECKQGGTLLLSVTLKAGGTAKKQEIASLSGILEYDTSLFTVEKADILPPEGSTMQESSFDAAEGKFTLKYASNITVEDAGQLMQIRLHVAADATDGKTTVCVTNMEWSDADGKNKETIEHRVPARITILKPEPSAAAGDVNGDGKVDLTDARLVMQHYNGVKALESSQEKGADTNGDGKINLTDVKLIMQYYNGEIDEFE